MQSVDTFVCRAGKILFAESTVMITGHDPGDVYSDGVLSLPPFGVTAPEGYSMSKGPSGFHHPGLAVN